MNQMRLAQFTKIKREIVLIQEQIKDLESSETYCTVKGSLTFFPYTQGTIPITGSDDPDLASCLAALKRKKRIKIRELRNELTNIESFIGSIEDSEMRQIFTLRYLNGLSWQHVAFKLGETDESYPRQKSRNFLKLPKIPKKT